MSNCLKFYCFFSFVGLAGCTGQKEAEAPLDDLADLREENLRLQREVTRLREVALKSERLEKSECATPGGADPDASEGDRETGSPAETQASNTDREHPDLPIVRLSPDDHDDTEPSVQDGVARIAFSDPDRLGDDEISSPEGTRPVLRVRGEHEAWVYHRQIRDDEESSPNQDESP